jgi:DNA replication protein DnaC
MYLLKKDYINSDTQNYLYSLITTNSNFSKWPDIFGSPTIANAILDRLLHHSHIVSIKGPSYRIQSKIQYLDNNSMKDSKMP